VSLESTPKDAAAVILLRHNTDPNDPEVFLVRRSEKLAFLGGFYAFPGGQREASDAETPIENCDDQERAAMISCAAREVFEEVGVLLAHGSETLTVGQRASLLDDLESKRMSWSELLRHYDLQLDSDDFTFVGRWVTPPFAPRRFDTWFFLVNCPQKQEPSLTAPPQPRCSPGDPGVGLRPRDDGNEQQQRMSAELESGEWITARGALERWQNSDMLAVPPTLHALKTLTGGLTGDLVERFLSVPHAHCEPVRRIEFRPNYICFPVRTPTKPPATHTNCYLIYNSREILVVDPASPDEDEQQVLAGCVDELLAEGRTVREIVLTHMHPDHVGGVNALKQHLEKTHRARAPGVAGHELTATALGDDIRVDRFIPDGETIELEGEPRISLRALHTPGHARGHLCFYEARTGTLISGDNIVGLGSVLIDPPEGNMRDYLASLERMRALPNLSVIFGGHGPAIANPYARIQEYLTHRLEREANILQAVRDGATTPKEIVARVYTDVSPKAHGMAERAVLAHLERLEADGRVSHSSDGGYVAGRMND
jgi:glyoxylase-like metal-dependent hydrolase (beta-lactamase superfamily II)/8-oxo-dGTP pyrophosphatase MutT (NUDIX family)